MKGGSRTIGDAERSQDKVIYALMSESFLAGFFRLDETRSICMGRGSEVDLTVPHSSVSRRHAELVWDDGGVSIQDLRSVNGTYVNGSTLLKPHRLAEGDRIQIGPFTYVFRTFESVEFARQAVASDKLGTVPLDFDLTVDAAREGRNYGGRELLSLCHLLNFRKHDGLLRVRGTSASGEIEFREGEVVGGEMGTLSGQEAVEAVLKQQNGHYQLTPTGSDPGEQRPLFRSTASFLSEFQVELDRQLFGHMALDQTRHG